MERLELDSYIKGNKISIPLMRFHVSINLLSNYNKLQILLDIKDSANETINLKFNTLEEAINFIQNIIKKSKDKEEIINKYQEMNTQKENNNIYLTPDEVDQALMEYFGSKKSYRVSIKEELTIANGEPKIVFYIIEHINDAITKDNTIRLTEGDLKNALEEYISFYGYELINFQYIGGIHHFYYDDDKPFYEGIKLNVKKKKKDQVLVKK